MVSDSIFSVRDQVVVVSGGTRGIGLAIAEGFAQRGARVVLTGRTTAAAEATAGQLAGGAEFAPLGLGCDVTRAGDIERLAADVLGRFGHVDTLVNVAGVNRRKPALEVDRKSTRLNSSH